MASTICTLVCVVILTIGLLGFGSAIRIVIHPESYNIMTEKLYIGCIPDEQKYVDRYLTLLEVSDQNNESIAYTFRDDVITSDGMRGNMEVAGSGSKDVRKSYLNLTINKPGKQDAGAYMCTVLYLDYDYNTYGDDAIANATFRESALRIITKPKQKKIVEPTDSELNIICIADGPAYRNKSVMSIAIMRQCQDQPIASVDMTHGLKMGPNSKTNMMPKGEIEAENGNSYLTLNMNNPCTKDGGRYTCQMTALDEKKQQFKEEASIHVRIANQEIKDLFREIKSQVSNLARTVRAWYSIQRRTIQRFEKQRQDVNALKQFFKEYKEANRLEVQQSSMKKQACPSDWSLAGYCNFCLKAFGYHSASKRLSWYEANEACQMKGAQLVKVNYHYQNDAVYLAFWWRYRGPFWIGISNNHTLRNDYKWKGNRWERVSPWREGEPNGMSPDESCVSMSTQTRKWFDTNCSTRQPYVCSKARSNF